MPNLSLPCSCSSKLLLPWNGRLGKLNPFSCNPRAPTTPSGQTLLMSLHTPETNIFQPPVTPVLGALLISADVQFIFGRLSHVRWFSATGFPQSSNCHCLNDAMLCRLQVSQCLIHALILFLRLISKTSLDD